MPFINLRTTKKLEEQEKTYLKNEFGKSISILPGKSEEWLMVSLVDQCSLYFQGQGKEINDIAFIEVKIYGKSDEESYDKLTEKLTDIVSKKLSIDPMNIYVEYEETPDWGFNGSNF